MNRTPEKLFELTSVNRNTYLFLFGIAIFPGLLIATLWAMNPAEFTQLPIWFLPVVVFLGPIIILVTMQGIRNPSVVLNHDSISIKVSFIKKNWEISALMRDQMRLVNLEHDKGLKPKWKLFGAALPGLRSGYFRLYDKQNAHVYLTDYQKVVYIPTNKGAILLSLQRPKEFMDYLQSL